MTSRSRSNRCVFVAWAVAVALVLSMLSPPLRAQDGEEELTFDELQEQRELAAQELADAAASIDATTATIEELATALDEVAALASIHQVGLEEASERYASALARLKQAEDAHEEVLAEIGLLRELVGDLALAQFTGESGREVMELALSNDPGRSSRLAHLFELQTGNAQDAMNRLRLLEFEAEELVAERNGATSLAERSLVEIEDRSGDLNAAIAQQEQLLEAAELRLAASESDAQAAEALIAETEERLLNYVRGIGAPAPVDRRDIVTISFFERDQSRPFYQIQVHKDIEEQTRGLYERAFSQGINLGGWGFRTTDRQIELRRSHCGDTDFDVWLKPAGQCSPPTARPGYSKHEQGRAIDFQWNGGSIGPRSGAAFQWLAANAPEFGFVNLPSEPWHWSDGTANTFDPTVPIPDFPDDSVPEVEPDENTAELLNEPLEEEDEVAAGEEVAVAVEIESEEAGPTEGDRGEGDSGETPSGDVLVVDETIDEQPSIEPPVDSGLGNEQPEASEIGTAEPAVEAEDRVEDVESPEAVS